MSYGQNSFFNGIKWGSDKVLLKGLLGFTYGVFDHGSCGIFGNFDEWLLTF